MIAIYVESGSLFIAQLLANQNAKHIFLLTSQCQKQALTLLLDEKCFLELGINDIEQFDVRVCIG